MWEGKIEWADDPYYSFMKGWTIKKAEEWFKQKPSTRPVQALIKHHEDWHKEHLKRIARYDGTRYGRNGEIID